MTSPLADTLQRTLGDAFRVDRELGGGGMSRVFVAHDLALDRDDVVKVLSDEATAGVSADRFRREIQLIARLQHPHVVPILSAGSADGSLYYTMPFVAGETLRARLAREGTLPIPDVVRLLREVLDALAFAHDHGVVHRDIKPENVLLASGHAVVADFGIAKALKESGTLTSAGFALGTPTYMAPEQATADPGTDHRADLYSVGVLGYELLTGAPPFTGSPQQVITQHLTTPPAPITSKRADVPDALADAITRALAKYPAERPGTAREMSAALDAVTTPAPGATRPAAALPPGSKPSASPRRGPIVAAAALAVTAAVGIFAWRTRAPTRSAPPVTAGADSIAVMPLVAVSDSSLARLGQDLVVTLSTNLDGVGSLHTVDAITLLMRARTAPSPMPIAEARKLARELGARSVLTGTLIHDNDRVRATVALHRVDGDSAIARATAVAAPRDVAALTDSLTWGILRQVWQRGTPPSPVLTGLTTKSVDALRAFLDGERQFQHLEAAQALASYRRAFELDSNFVQAYLRHEYVNQWQVSPQHDSTARARLLALKDRLPERERSWLETEELYIPFPEKVARWKALAERYPDYPPVLMSAADPIIHSGPMFGIPITEARPYLDRLERLVPDHGDTRFHVALVQIAVGSADSTANAVRHAARVMGSSWRPILGWVAEQYDAYARGAPRPAGESVLALGRTLATRARGGYVGRVLTGTAGMDSPTARWRLEALEQIRAAGLYSGDLELESTFGEGLVRSQRGDWAGALRALRRTEGSSLHFSERMASARVATFGAWVGAVELETADGSLRRVRAMPSDDVLPVDLVELRWLDGMLGVLAGDEPRARRAQRELLADTSNVARRAARSIAGHWLARTDAEAGADTLLAASDGAMREGLPLLLTVEGIDRLVVARALRRRGSPAEVERYLMWVDGWMPVARNTSAKLTLQPLVQYERALAAEDAGDRAAAAYRLRRFVANYDQPPPAHRALVEDAKRRLAQLVATDAPAPRTVAPR